MAIRSGSIRKKCYCKDESGRRLGAGCSRLKLASGAWSSGHGVWAFQIELPPAPGGRRRILRRVSNTQPGTRADVAAELARVCELMSLADGDEALADEIAEVLMACKRGRPLPDPRQLARQLRSGVPNASSISVGEYLTWWVAHRNIDEHTRLGYASHVRVHLDPHLGHLPLARLNSTHIEAMFATITGRNRQILDDRASADPARAGAATATRLTTPATIARVRATLRKALLLDMRKKLGHASVTVTGDIYPASLDNIDRMIAERTAALIPRNRPAGPRTDTDPTGPDSPRAVPPATDPKQQTKDQVPAQEDAGSPTDSPTPRPPATGTAGTVPWPRPGRRRDRYPRGVR